MSPRSKTFTSVQFTQTSPTSKTIESQTQTSKTQKQCADTQTNQVFKKSVSVMAENPNKIFKNASCLTETLKKPNQTVISGRDSPIPVEKIYQDEVTLTDLTIMDMDEMSQIMEDYARLSASTNKEQASKEIQVQLRQNQNIYTQTTPPQSPLPVVKKINSTQTDTAKSIATQKFGVNSILKEVTVYNSASQISTLGFSRSIESQTSLSSFSVLLGSQPDDLSITAPNSVPGLLSSGRLLTTTEITNETSRSNSKASSTHKSNTANLEAEEMEKFYNEECDFKSISEVANSSLDITSPHSSNNSRIAPINPDNIEQSIGGSSCSRARREAERKVHNSSSSENEKKKSNANNSTMTNRISKLTKFRKSSGKFETSDEAYNSEQMSPRNILNCSEVTTSTSNSKLQSASCNFNAVLPENVLEESGSHPRSNRSSIYLCRRCSEDVSDLELKNLRERLESKESTYSCSEVNDGDISTESVSDSDASTTESNISEDLNQIEEYLKYSPSTKYTKDPSDSYLLNKWELLCRAKIKSEHNYDKISNIIKTISIDDPKSLLVETPSQDNPLHLAILNRNYKILDLILENYSRDVLETALFKFNVNGYCPILICCAMLRVEEYSNQHFWNEEDRKFKIGVLERILDFLVTTLPKIERTGSTSSDDIDLVDDRTNQIIKTSYLNNLCNRPTSSTSSSPTSQVKKNSLILAASYNNYHATKYLLKLNCEIDITDSLGNTALILASENNHLKIVRLLLENGADTSLCNFENFSALNVAVNNKNNEVGVLIYQFTNF